MMNNTDTYQSEPEIYLWVSAYALAHAANNGRKSEWGQRITGNTVHADVFQIYFSTTVHSFNDQLSCDDNFRPRVVVIDRQKLEVTTQGGLDKSKVLQV